MNLVSKIVAFVAAVFVGYLALDHYTPGATAEVRGMVLQYGTNWSDQAIQRDPVGFMRYTKQQLQEKQAAFTQGVNDLRKNIHPLNEYIQEETEALAKTNALLKEGRAVYRIAEEKDKTEVIDAIKFAGRTYPDLTTFKSQLQLLYNEKLSKEGLLKQSEGTRTQLNAQLSAMLVQQGKLAMAIQEIDPKIAIAKASSNMAELNNLLDQTQSVSLDILTTSDQQIEAFGPIGNTAELIESMKNSVVISHDTDRAFEAFLNG